MNDKTTAEKKLTLKKAIMHRLSYCYRPASGPFAEVRHALNKLSLSELNSLYVMVTTSTKNPK